MRTCDNIYNFGTFSRLSAGNSCSRLSGQQSAQINNPVLPNCSFGTLGTFMSCPRQALLSFTKVDAISGLPLAGTTFQLRDAQGNIMTAVSDANGLVSFQIAPCTAYTLTETTPPVGYAANTQQYTVWANQQGCVYIDGQPAACFRVANQPLATITILYTLTGTGTNVLPPQEIAVTPGSYSVANPPAIMPIGTDCTTFYYSLSGTQNAPAQGIIAPGQNLTVNFVYNMSQCPIGMIFNPTTLACIIGECPSLE